MYQQFQTNKQDLSQTQIVTLDETRDLNPNEIRVSVSEFAFTANNITYGVVGERIRYWEFFPAIASPSAPTDSTQWGVIPVWGFAQVSESKHPDVAVGEKLFGYFPPATSLIIEPTKVGPLSLIDASAHRATLPAAYNVYRRVSREPGYNSANDAYRMLLYPLYLTAFCIHDMFANLNWHGAEQIIIISASSKTSIGTAFAIANDSTAPKVLGLTSGRNEGFVKSLKLYDSVHTYDAIETIDPNVPSMIIDMSGNGEVIGRLHKHLGANMKFSSHVGITHWDDAAMGPDFIAERSQQFFAPGHIQQRIKEWGASEFESRSAKFIDSAARAANQWLVITHADGLEGLSSVYPDVLNGSANPQEGIIVVVN